MHILTLQENQQTLEKLIEDYTLYLHYQSEMERHKKSPQNGIFSLKMQQISDRMKYPNPWVWIHYKIQAYAHTSQAIVTVADLKNHCEAPTHICHQRFDFLTNILNTQYHIDIYNPDFHTDEILQIITKDILLEISQNPEYMQSWWKYEYYQEGNRVAKWENYRKKSV